MGDPCEVFPEIARHVHDACMAPGDAAANKDKQCSPLCWAHEYFWYGATACCVSELAWGAVVVSACVLP